MKHGPEHVSRRRLLKLSVLLALCLGYPATSAAAAGERQVKAAFLYKFPAYVEWPKESFANADTPFRIGVLGAEAMVEELTQMVAGRTAQGRPVIVRKLQKGEDIGEVHMLFVGSAEAGSLPAAAKAVLLVTEAPQGQGGMINFVLVDGRVRFEIAPRAAELAGLVISSRLLGVAWRVGG